MNNLLQQIDIEKFIGQVTLTNGDKLNIPKITMLKIIKIVKFLGIDATKLYNDMQDVVKDPDLDEFTKVSVILESLKEEQLIHIFSILLDMDDYQALSLDLNEMLDVILLYLEKTNIAKTFTQVRQIYKKMFNKDLPDLGKWFSEKQEATKQLQEMKERALKEAGNQ